MGILRRQGSEVDYAVNQGEADLLRRMADAGQSLERLESVASVAEALPGIALGLVRADGALLVKVEGSSVVRVASRGVRLEVGAPVWLEGVLGAAWSGQPRILSSSGRPQSAVRPAVNPAAPLPPASQRLGREVPGRALLVPVTGAPEPWVLVVGRVGPGEVFVPADLGPLSIVRTLAESSLARIRAAASLAEVVAREAALLDASSEAVLALDAAGVVRAMSASASDRLGVGRERVVGRRLADVGALAAVAEVVGGDGGRIGAIVLVQGVPFLVRVTGHEGGSILTFTQPTDPAADGGRPARTDEGAEPRVPTWDEMERVTIRQALRHHGGSVARAAKALGVAKGTVYNKMRRYGIDLPTGTSARGGVDDPTGESC